MFEIKKKKHIYTSYETEHKERNLYFQKMIFSLPTELKLHYHTSLLSGVLWGIKPKPEIQSSDCYILLPVSTLVVTSCSFSNWRWLALFSLTDSSHPSSLYPLLLGILCFGNLRRSLRCSGKARKQT